MLVIAVGGRTPRGGATRRRPEIRFRRSAFLIAVALVPGIRLDMIELGRKRFMFLAAQGRVLVAVSRGNRSAMPGLRGTSCLLLIV